MNRRIKTEEPSKSAKSSKMFTSKKTTGTTGSKLLNVARAKIKTPVRKKAIKKSKSIFRKDACSDDEFKVPGNIRNAVFNTRSTTSRRNIQSASAPNIIKPRKTIIPENIYQISDSSDDDDDLQIVRESFKNSETELINLCETDDSINESKVNILDEILNEVKNNASRSHPSTSTSHSVNRSEVPAFVDNLLDSNEDLLDENYLKSMKELSDQNEKLLQSSWNLLNNTQKRTFEDSVIFVGAEDSSQKSAQNLPETSVVPIPEPVQITSTEQQQVKTSCPVCLEKLGSQPVSSTICGHIFCTACIKNCIKSQKKCPTCRKHLTAKMVHPLFLF